MDQNNTAIIVVNTLLLFDDITDSVGGSICFWLKVPKLCSEVRVRRGSVAF